MNPLKGPLKLKGDASLLGKKKGKKKKKDKEAQDKAPAAAAVEGKADAGQPKAAYKTEAQRKHEEYQAKREKAKLDQMASKSHRERVQEYNEKLSQLTEHNDIPKVGPG
eukprot:jgi/Ulvmu1/10888/UM007_0064.1